MFPREIRPATFASAQFFSHPAWVAELKYDGFRALTYPSPKRTWMVSRKGIPCRRFDDLCHHVASALGPREAILDGEIVCVDGRGRPRFYDLMFRRGEPVFCAFDILWSGGKDLRQLPLLMRKRILRKLIPAKHTHILYVDFTADLEGRFDLVCERHLEGIVMKPKAGVMRTAAG